MEIQQVRSAHFIGIGGIGVSAIARLFLHWGSAASGSDAKRSEITDELGELGATIAIGHAAENVPADAELIVYSPAVPAENPERVEAARLGIPQKSYPEMLGELMAGTFGIAVSGTNGKTTTTALLGHMLVEAGLDPTVIVGSKVGNFNGANLRVGKGPHVVVEGCEYRRHFLNLRPKMIVLTNIEVDHLDYFKDFDDIKSAFREYLALLTPEGTLVYNRDDPAVVEVVQTSHAKKIAYGTSRHYNILIYDSDGGAADVQLISRAVKGGRQSLRVRITQEEHEFQLRLPGEIYAFNALAAIAAAHALGVRVEEIQKAVASFRGTWRRFERIGEVEDKPIISDYAHHPTAVRETLRAAREFFPGKRILAVFQPHQRNRTKNLLADFAASFDAADNIIIAEIYDVAGREEGLEISSRDLASRLHDAGRRAQYGANLDETLALIKDQLHSVDVVLIMGAGDIYTIGQKLF
ncbi:UDP-N-acetylmuramate--L-alanine ligase [Candidatus Parcubacteria bacterium]|nr:UDP-N-acetylmuramate--L-alanine ligase [Candidatus Parcubacteria bacterium]